MGIGQISITIGCTLVAVTMFIGIIGIIRDTTIPATSTLGIYGHYTIQISDSDGNIMSYIQTDNAPTHLFKDCLFDSYFGTTIAGAGTCAISSGAATLIVGDGGDTLAFDDTNTVLGNYYSNSGAGTALITATNSSSTNETAVAWDNVADPITITQTDLNGSADASCGDPDSDGATECSLDEVGLLDTDGDLISRASFSDTLVNNGDTVDITLTITLKE